MEVVLDRDFKITTNSYNYILSKFKEIKKKGEIPKFKWDEVGYYPTLQTALTGYVKHKGLKTPTETVQGLTDLLEDIKFAIENVPNLLPKDLCDAKK